MNHRTADSVKVLPNIRLVNPWRNQKTRAGQINAIGAYMPARIKMWLSEKKANLCPNYSLHIGLWAYLVKSK